MLTALPESPTIASFIDTMRSERGAAAVGVTGEFLANQCRYQLSWGVTGPQVRRIDAERHPLSSFFPRRLCEGELSSYASRMTRALAEDRTARRNCLEVALSSWCVPGVGSRREAVQRILACRAGTDRQNKYPNAADTRSGPVLSAAVPASLPGLQGWAHCGAGRRAGAGASASTCRTTAAGTRCLMREPAKDLAISCEVLSKAPSRFAALRVALPAARKVHPHTVLVDHLAAQPSGRRQKRDR